MSEPKAFTGGWMTSAPYEKAQMAREEGCTMRVFDWDKAKQIIEEKDIKDADCGLLEDWFWTGATLIENGVMVSPEECNAYLSSIWATPVIRWEDGDISCEIPCWKFEE